MADVRAAYPVEPGAKRSGGDLIVITISYHSFIYSGLCKTDCGAALVLSIFLKKTQINAVEIKYRIAVVMNNGVKP